MWPQFAIKPKIVFFVSSEVIYHLFLFWPSIVMRYFHRMKTQKKNQTEFAMTLELALDQVWINEKFLIFLLTSCTVTVINCILIRSEFIQWYKIIEKSEDWYWKYAGHAEYNTMKWFVQCTIQNDTVSVDINLLTLSNNPNENSLHFFVFVSFSFLLIKMKENEHFVQFYGWSNKFWRESE